MTCDRDRANRSYLTYLGDITRVFIAKHFGESRVDEYMEHPLIGPNGLRRQMGELDLEYFARAYFPEYFAHPVPQFHKDAYTELTDVLSRPPATARKVRAWPRGNAKSTIYNFFTPTNAALYGKRFFVVIVSDTETQAQSFLSDIKDAVENNQHIRDDFGDLRGNVWRVGEISIRSSAGKTTITAVGAESGIRGIRQAQHRPDFIIVDDLEDDQATQTYERVAKRWSWFTRALMSLGNEYTDILVVGTVLAYDCVLDRLLNHPAWDAKRLEAIISWSSSSLWDEWRNIYTDMSLDLPQRTKNSRAFYERNKDEMLAGTEVLWPEGKPYISLMEIYTSIGDLAFFAEHQNSPVNPQECPFDPAWFLYYDPAELNRVRITSIVGALDPSLGKSRMGDYTAFITLGKGDNGFIYVLDAVIERMTPDKIIDMVIEKSRKFKYTRIGVEVNQFQDLLRMQLINEGARQGAYLPVTELRHNRDKVMRVQTLIPFVKNGYIRFGQDQSLLVHQLQGFPKLRHDDGPDALEMAVRMMARGPTIHAMPAGVASRSDYFQDDFSRDDSINAGGWYN